MCCVPAAHVLIHISEQMARWYVDLRYNSIIVSNRHHALQTRRTDLKSLPRMEQQHFPFCHLQTSGLHEHNSKPS